MVIKPRLKGGLALTNHPIGAKEFVKRQIDYIKSQDKYTGPNAHLIAVDEANDSVVFPKVKGLLHTK